MNNIHKKNHRAFTLIEVLIVVAIIGILAAIASVSYIGSTEKAKVASLKNDLQNTAIELRGEWAENKFYPESWDSSHIKNGNTFEYTAGKNTFCITATNSDLQFSITENGVVTEGSCPPPYMQNFSIYDCLSERTALRDARDGKTYYVKNINGNCWMLTNLAYAGSGNGTFGDIKKLNDGTNDSSNSYTSAKYYIPSGANPTTYPTLPSGSTSGSGQYGYLYNWCAAMGNQQNTSACLEAGGSEELDYWVSVCPAGWSLPKTADFGYLNSDINGGSSASDTNMRINWLSQRAGYWNNKTFTNTGTVGYYWSSSDMNGANVRAMSLSQSSVNTTSSFNKGIGMAVRCLQYAPSA